MTSTTEKLTEIKRRQRIRRQRQNNKEKKVLTQTIRDNFISINE